MNLAEKWSDEEVTVQAARLVRCCGMICEVDCAGRILRAARAAGCLLEPVPGDQVLVATAGDGRAWVTTVLFRNAGQTARLNTQGDLVLASRGGRLVLAGREGLDLRGPGLGLHAERLDLACGDLELHALDIRTTAVRLRAVISGMEVRIGRLLERVGSLFRRIGTEDTRVDEVFTAVDQDCTLRARGMSVSAEERLRLDGERVELG